MERFYRKISAGKRKQCDNLEFHVLLFIEAHYDDVNDMEARYTAVLSTIQSS